MAALLCGVCALSQQIAFSACAGARPEDPIFADLQGSRGRNAFATVARSIGLPAHWHAFRRGMASDMLARGDSLYRILSGGGWQSAAFLQYLSSEDVEDRLAMEQAFLMSDEEDA